MFGNGNVSSVSAIFKKLCSPRNEDSDGVLLIFLRIQLVDFTRNEVDNLLPAQ